MSEKSAPEIRFKGYTDAWERRKLSEMSNSFEYGLNASATFFDGVNKYIRITDIDDENRLFNQSNLTSPNADFSNIDNYLMKKDDILFARTGASVGKTYRYQDSDGKVYFAGFLIRARIKENFDSEFVFQNTLTSRYDNFIKVTSQRSGQPGVNAQEYASFESSVPIIEEQMHIGKFFKQLDDTITLHQRKLDKLKQLKQGYLKQIFEQKLRFSDFTNEWKQNKLSNLMIFSNGINAPKENYGKGRKMISVMDILAKEPFIYEKIRNSVEVEDKIEQKSKVENGDLVFVRSSEIAEEVGWAKAYLQDEYALYSGFSIRGKKKNNYDAYFIELSLNSVNRKQIESKAGGSTRFNVSQEILNNIVVTMPILDEQIKISNFFKQLSSSMFLHQEKIEKLMKLKKSYLQKMFI
ncbi:restriction endonuclease subunit S [Paenibacillus kyungheensis]|uniref:Restriction endonuclease subunit S n=1 Tax=Paenibacillus kyungheensis TaxID=1452732 RepID=A0AAX3LYX5_9BACL|nr:restriction endonuclease subunit S [Paenibacillus kyungheensis]WCT55091.1 restriction endonuclease subunit S [Paenibacillus kyungheensis]